MTCLRDKQIIDRVTELAADLTPVSDIAVFLDVNEDLLRMELRSPSSPLGRAYRRTKAETSLALRRQELALARVGSPLAVQMAASYLRDMDADEDF